VRLDGETWTAALRRLLGELTASFRPGSVASSEEMARGGALLYGPGALLVAVATLLPHPGAELGVLTPTALTAAGVAAGLWFWGDRLPRAVYPALCALGTLLITVAVHFGGVDGPAFAFLYVWAALYAFYFFFPGQILLQILLIGIGFMLVGTAPNTPLGSGMVMATVCIAGVLMRGAVDRLRQRERSFRFLFETNPQPMWVYAAEGHRFLAVNDAAVAQYGYSREELAAMRLSDIVPAGRTMTLPATGSGAPAGSHREVHRLKDGRSIETQVFVDHAWFEQRPAVLALCIDVTEQTAMERELRHRAFHDPLTKLANRTLLRDRLAHALARRRREPAPLGVVVIDLDDFKAVNDTLGHGVGDELLIAVADRLCGLVRPGDTVAHIGGDEFAMLLDGAGTEELIAVAQRILGAFHTPLIAGGSEIFVSASVGGAVSSAGRTVDELLRDADLAMYSAKTAGKNRFEVYAPARHGGQLRRLERATDLRRAAENDELFLEYQPVISLSTGAVASIEALVRWRHPRLGVISPADFIPLAEETGLMVPIGSWVLRAACEQMRRWEVALPRASHFPVAVNVSPQQLRESQFVDEVDCILRDTQLQPSRLTIEVTESVMVHDLAAVRERLERLRASGVRVALDDFGSGYSSLGYLRGLPLDLVKIDRVFVGDLDLDPETPSLIASIVRLLQALDLDIVAEGVETSAQLEHVRALGVDWVQGYLLSPPADADSLVRRLRGDLWRPHPVRI
jgi:diguanylate cyclase (GGDEF)-like protein/PAS domain S-box-containing protein